LFRMKILPSLPHLKGRTGPEGMALACRTNNASARALFCKAGFAEADRTPIVTRGWQISGTEWILMTQTQVGLVPLSYRLRCSFKPPSVRKDDCQQGQTLQPDHASSSPPQIAEAFFLRTRRAAVSAKAFSLRASSRSRTLIRFFSSLVAWLIRAVLVRSQSFACSQAPRHVLICSAKSPRLRQYSDRSASFIAAVSSTAANLSRDA